MEVEKTTIKKTDAIDFHGRSLLIFTELVIV